MSITAELGVGVVAFSIPVSVKSDGRLIKAHCVGWGYEQAVRARAAAVGAGAGGPVTTRVSM